MLASHLHELIAFPTISSQSNLSCIDYLENHCKRAGFQTEKVYNANKTKASLLASAGPNGSGGLLLAGHTDVVPVTNQVWSHDPFSLIEREGRFYGRGTADMKGFIAVILDLLPELSLKNLAAPLHLCFTYDEEVGCWGAKQLQERFSNLPGKPRVAIIGEPTSMQLVNAHKSLTLSSVTVKGKSAHSSCPHLGSSSITPAAELVSRLPSLMPQERDSSYTPPNATCNVGRILGGQAVNIIPEHYWFEWERRLLPNQSNDEVEEIWKAEVSETISRHKGIEIEHKMESNIPGLSSEGNQEALSWLLDLFPEQRVTTAPFVTEAGIYQQAGIPTIVCGPGHVAQAHKPDEYVELAQLAQCKEFLRDLVAAMPSKSLAESS